MLLLLLLLRWLNVGVGDGCVRDFWRIVCVWQWQCLLAGGTWDMYGTFLSDWAGGPGKVSVWIGLDWIGWWYLKKERVEEEVGKQARGWEGLK